MPGFNGLHVDGPSGPRWELALSLLASGEAPVRLGPLEIWRSVAGPNADGVLRVTLTLDASADEHTGLSALGRGREMLDQWASADPRLSGILGEFGYRWELVADYGMGATLLGTASARGDLVWKP